MATRMEYGQTGVHDDSAVQRRAAIGEIPTESRLHSLDTIGVLLALAVILGPLAMGAFFR